MQTFIAPGFVSHHPRNDQFHGSPQHRFRTAWRVRYIFQIAIERALFMPFFCSHFLVNSADRIIRVYDAKEIIACGKDGDPEPMQRLQDLVNK